MRPLPSRSAMRGTIAAIVLAFPFSFLYGSDALTWEQQEALLAKGKITQAKDAKKGVTGTWRVTLTDGTLTHDASVQTIDEYKPQYLNEVAFKDSYKFNVAGWQMARLLGIGDMVPVSVKRNYDGKAASYTWWIDNVAMDETERRSKNAKAPDVEAWNRENAVMVVFDQLIFNVDRNQTNMLIDDRWHLWLIDHSRAFRDFKSLKDAAALKSIDRNMLARMKALDQATLTKELGKDISKDEIKGLLARRDVIVKLFEAKGESALFDRPSRN